MALAEHDHVVQAFPANTPDEPFHIRVLPGTPRGGHNFGHAQAIDTLMECRPVDTISITEEIPRRLISGKGLDHLLGRP
jgi:hypothetical protein